MQVPEETEIKRKFSLENLVDSAGAAMQSIRDSLSPEKAGDLLGVLGGGSAEAKKDAEKATPAKAAYPVEEPARAAAKTTPAAKREAKATAVATVESVAATAEPSGGLPALILAICTCKMPLR